VAPEDLTAKGADSEFGVKPGEKQGEIESWPDPWAAPNSQDTNFRTASNLWLVFCPVFIEW
jgi:hypothetical protein